MKYFNETYKKREFLRRNEWADTYRATHAVTDEHVTLKVLAKKSNDEEYINNLLKEVETIKTIKNPNLIHVNNMFKYSGFGKTYYYIEGEYFKGDSLKEVIENSKIDIKESVKIVERAAEGIKEFHDKNILFNSLNLENILMNSREIIKVDVLSYLEQKSFCVKEDESLEENKFNPQKDIYALGAVLYCLLSGNQIFDNNKYKKDIKDDILIKIIDRATNPQCESRYINIDRMIMDLKSYLKTGDIKSDNYDYNDEISNKNKKQKKPKKEKVEKKTKKNKTEVKKDQATNKKEDKDKKGKLGKTFAVCTTVALLAGATVYGYEYLEKNGFEFNKITASDESDKVELNKELKEENKVEETKKEESTKENQTNKKEENKTATSKKEENNKKTETTTSSNNSKKDKNTSGSNNSSNKNNSTSSDDSTDKENTSSNISKPNSNTSKPDSNTNKPNSNTSKPNNNTAKPNNNSSKPNNNQNSGNTTKPEEGGNDSGNDNINQTPAVTPDTDNSTENNAGEVEATPENELATE